MASLLARIGSIVVRSGRSACQEYACSTSAPMVGVQPRRCSGTSSTPVTSRWGERTIVRSIPVSGPGSAGAAASGGVAGQVTSELLQSMRAKICEALETETCTVTDLYGDGRHVSIDVVSSLFTGKNSMQRQRMVYKAIWLELQEAVHAVDSMSTKTPEEVAN